MGNQLPSIPRILGGLLLGFLALLGIRITYPIANKILSLFTPSIATGSMMKIVAILGMYLIYVFVTWFLIWIYILEQPNPLEKLKG